MVDINEIINDPAKMMFCIFCLMIVLDIIIGMVFLTKAKSFAERAVSVMADITKIETAKTSKGHQYARLHVTYKDGMGQEYTSTMSAQLNQYNEGDQFEVLYDPDNPDTVKANNRLIIFIVPYALLGGSFAIAIMLAVLVTQGIAKTPF